jgi:hypothetical protein
MDYRGRVTVVFSLLLVLCLGTSVLLLMQMDRLRSDNTSGDVLYLPSSRTIKRLSLGYTGLAACIYWTRAVQYFGYKHRQQATDYPLLAPLLEITTDLDPKLSVAYQFGATFLAQKPPAGAGQPDKAVELVEKGIREIPDQWRLYYALGFLHSMERQDYLAAAKAFQRGSEVPNAHPALKILAAAMAQQGGDRSTARLLWITTYETTQDYLIRENAQQHIYALRVDDDILHLTALIERYHAQTGKYPRELQDLIRAGLLGGIPGDPLGHPYILRPQGKIEVQSPQDLPFITLGLPAGQ